jgi:hypothetical protein
MAKQAAGTNQDNLNTFIKGLHKDSDPAFIQEGMWTHARNAVNNTIEGDLGTLSNEASNALCTVAGATMPNTAAFRYIIGTIHLFSDKWVVYTAGHKTETTLVSVMSEIGLFEVDSCTYRPIVQDACLNFSKSNLVSGASRELQNCSWQVYWADGLNPDRVLNLGDSKLWPSLADYSWAGAGANVNYYISLLTPGLKVLWPGVTWKQLCTDSLGSTQTSPGVWASGHPVGCVTCADLNELDCDGIRLARLMKTPCLKLNIAEGSGSLENGSYYAVIAYTIQNQKVTDYFAPSNVQPVYTLTSSQGSLVLEVEADTENFDEFELVLVANINENTAAIIHGYYSTRTKRIFIEQFAVSKPAVDPSIIGLITPIFEKSDQMTQLNNYLLRIGPTTKFDFNYQPLANLIQTEWVAVEYPSDYYFKGGSNTNYMRDEVYAFFIRWVYDTGDKSASYHIPGRAARRWGPNSFFENAPNSLINGDSFPGDTKIFQTINTATQTSTGGTQLPDGGTIVGIGDMGYWESTEVYPDTRPDIWNASEYLWTGKFQNPSDSYDLCGLPIRHHKFPENVIYNPVTGNLTNLTGSSHFRKDPVTGALFIRVMGVRFKNIILPKDNDGVDISNIVGYEILRGGRDGNRSIVAKGMINNFRDYERQGVTANTRKGLYANYPFNTIYPIGNTLNSSDHNYQYNDPYIKSVDNNNDVVNQNIPNNLITFHSPDTTFRNPYLGIPELKLYGYLSGLANQQFIEPQGHPKFVILSNEAFFIALISGLLNVLLRSGGKKTFNYPQGGFTGQWELPLAGGNSVFPGVEANLTAIGPMLQANNYFTTQLQTYTNGGVALANAFSGQDTLDNIYNTHNTGVLTLVGGNYTPQEYSIEASSYSMLPSWVTAGLSIAGAVSHIAFFFSEGAQAAIDVLYALGPYRQYALQMVAHGLYDTFNPFNINDTKRFRIADAFYIAKNTSAEVRNYQNTVTGNIDSYTINNYKRPKILTIRTERANNNQTDGPKLLVGSTIASGLDQSLGSLGMFDDSLVGVGPTIDEQGKQKEFQTRIASHYGALKINIEDQYGNLRSIVQLPATPCEQKIPSLPVSNIAVNYFLPDGTPTSTIIQQKIIPFSIEIFGGDTYVCRFTEKNPMFFFYDWLYGEPNGYEYNYYNNQMIPEPRYWLNSEKYNAGNLQVTNAASWATLLNNSTTGTGFFPKDFYNLDNENYNRVDDKQGSLPGFLYVKDSYFYLSASGVRDFVVESDVLLDFREVGVFDYEKCYQPYQYTDLYTMFRMDKLTATEGNYYIYDQSLSINRLTNRFTSFGFLQSVFYDPNVAELCYTYLPNTITYSLPTTANTAIDYWYMFLPFNRKNFIGQISSVKNFAKTGAFVTFKNESPIVFQGVDTLEMDGSGTKVIIGDGGLFAREPQNIVVTDQPYMYGSSQGRLSVISTPAGMYYISQDQGKIFAYSEGLQEINQAGMKWWFDEFLPSKLLADFPEFPFVDNAVAGIATQAIYDNANSVLYFCKKDYKLKQYDQYGNLIKPQVTYFNSGKESYFIYVPIAADGKLLPPVKLPLGDPLIFEDASWTMSYDPKSKFWISFHDWHPNLLMPTKDSFVSIIKNELWQHYYSCNDYCNFYGNQYPFEIEFPVSTGQTVTTLKSIEYILECYRRDTINCMDQFHVLDYNFDQAVIYNSEQISGYLNLNLFPKNNITLSLDYPKLNQSNLSSFDILFSKEEQKYRINQFWDITKDRGEFPLGSGYPPTGQLIPNTTILLGNYPQELLWITESNGYKKSINPNSVNYNKDQLQRKKFRHMVNFVHLSKKDTRDTNMVFKMFNTKNQYSFR